MLPSVAASSQESMAYTFCVYDAMPIFEIQFIENTKSVSHAVFLLGIPSNIITTSIQHVWKKDNSTHFALQFSLLYSISLFNSLVFAK